MPRTATAEAARATAARPIFFNFIRFLRPDAHACVEAAITAWRCGWGPACIVKGEGMFGLLGGRSAVFLLTRASQRAVAERPAGDPRRPFCVWRRSAQASYQTRQLCSGYLGEPFLQLNALPNSSKFCT